MTIAKELEDRLVYLSDRRVRWVQKEPARAGESCLIYDGTDNWGDSEAALSTEAVDFLDWFVEGYGPELDSYSDWYGYDAMGFNDSTARRRAEVLWFLEEAAADAKERGL